LARIDTFLELGRKQGCSDIHFAAGRPPLVRQLGRLSPVKFRDLAADEVKDLLFEILSDEQKEEVGKGRDLDFAYSGEGIGRFRVNVFRKIGGWGATFRVVPPEVPRLADLGLPDVVETFSEIRQGLVLVTGAAGTGKTTTLAALVDVMNRRHKLNIITLEDPIEYIHQSRESLVIQREVGTHVRSFAVGLRATLREDPDVILVGELRDLETISLAMTAAETGHLVFGTLHTTSAAKTLDRIIDVVPARQKGQTALFLSQHLLGVISQVLVRTSDGQGRRAVVEVMVSTPAISSLILHRKIYLIPDKLQTGRAQGMQLLDQALLEGVREGVLDPNDAYLRASDRKLLQRYVTDPSILPRVSIGGH